MTQQLSIVASDVALAIVCAFGLFVMLTKDWATFIYAALGFFLIFLSALIGSFRYGLDNNNSDVADAHKLTSWLGSTVGLCLIATQIYLVYNRSPYEMIFLAAAIICLVVHFVLDADQREAVDDAAFGVSLLGIFLLCLLKFNIFGMGGSAAILFGRVKAERSKDPGEGGDLNRDEVFIMLYAIGMLGFTQVITGHSLVELVI